MAHSHRNARLDVHGYPLPELADVREEVLLTSAANQRRRRFLQTLVDDLCKQYLRRGQNVEIQVNFVVADGTITEHIYEHVTRRWQGDPALRPSPEER